MAKPPTLKEQVDALRKGKGIPVDKPVILQGDNGPVVVPPGFAKRLDRMVDTTVGENNITIHLDREELLRRAKQRGPR